MGTKNLISVKEADARSDFQNRLNQLRAYHIMVFLLLTAFVLLI